MWQAGPAWPRHAPILFPIVGELAGGGLRVGGARYPLGRHGFARDRTFHWLDRGADGCALLLADDAQTHACFPYPFRLVLEYRVKASALDVTASVTNPGPDLLPCSLGFHPAFRWPLGGQPRQGHRIELSEPEADTIGQLDAAGLLAPRRVPSPLRERRILDLSGEVFAHDALIFDPVRSRQARYGAPGGPSLTIAWDGASSLGLWSKPADFVCIEPWHGIADPAGFEGEFSAKPGLWHIPPGQSRRLSMTITLG